MTGADAAPAARVILLAAGMGQRLGARTARTPKVLLPLGGTPLLAHLLAKLAVAGFEDVVCVTGHGADLVRAHVSTLKRRPRVTFVHNDAYDSTNNIVSAALTFDFWEEPFVLADADLLVATPLLRRLRRFEGCAMTIDRHRSFAEADLKAEVRGDRVWHLDKELPAARFSGEGLGLSRWTRDGAACLRTAIEQLLARTGGPDLWYPYAIREVAKQIPVRPFAVGTADWVEIDHPHDHDAAEQQAALGAAWLDHDVRDPDG